jgi:DNA-binding MarR family transcriptional regulator
MSAQSSDDLALVTGLYRATNAAVRELDQRLSREHDITFIQAVTLLAINSFDRPQPHLVADYLSQQSQTVTGVLDRLERAAHVSRQRDLGDRRAVRLELTESGRNVVSAIASSLTEHVVDVLSGIESSHRSRLQTDLASLEEAIRSSAPKSVAS